MTANEVSASYIAGRRDQRDFPNLRDGKAAFPHPASPGEISAPDGNFIIKSAEYPDLLGGGMNAAITIHRQM